MVFPTIEFAAFFVVVLTGSWLLMPHPRVWRPFILAASYVFYGYTDARFVLLLVVSTLVNQTAALAVHHSTRAQVRKAVVVAAVAADLGLLGWFKYYGFFALSVDSTLSKVGLGAPMPLLQVALPIGISFFTFQAMSYVLDVNRGKLAPVPLMHFAVYEAFFPHLVAGPIVRASEFLPQLDSPRDPRAIPSTRAFFLIGGGLVKKVVLADLLATRIVDPVFASPGQHSGLEVVVAVYAYAVQIFCDFSAYSEMAIGLALLLDFRFPDNFDRPYTAASLTEFWRRWHMTLSRWLREYLYIPLDGNRGGRRRTYRNLMLTMLLGGLWHGAAWTFVIWGGLHGLGLAWERRRDERGPRRRAAAGPSAAWPSAAWPSAAGPAAEGPSAGGPVGVRRVTGAGAATGGGTATALLARSEADGSAAPARAGRPVWVGRLVTFHLVCLAWVFFRAPDLGTVWALVGRLTSFGPSPLVTPAVLAAIAAGIGVQYLPTRFWDGAKLRFAGLATWQQGLLLGALLVVVNAAVGEQGVAPFIYFRF